MIESAIAVNHLSACRAHPLHEAFDLLVHTDAHRSRILNHEAPQRRELLCSAERSRMPSLPRAVIVFLDLNLAVRRESQGERSRSLIPKRLVVITED